MLSRQFLFQINVSPAQICLELSKRGTAKKHSLSFCVYEYWEALDGEQHLTWRTFSIVLKFHEWKATLNRKIIQQYMRDRPTKISSRQMIKLLKLAWSRETSLCTHLLELSSRKWSAPYSLNRMVVRVSLDFKQQQVNKCLQLRYSRVQKDHATSKQNSMSCPRFSYIT